MILNKTHMLSKPQYYAFIQLVRFAFTNSLMLTSTAKRLYIFLSNKESGHINIMTGNDNYYLL